MPGPINVLIVEDDPVWQKIITTNLELYGCNVSVCVDNMEAASLILNQVTFDVALVNIYLGDDASGVELGKLIRNDYGKPFIFLSGEVDVNLFSSMIAANPSSYLVKPFTAASLFLSVNNAITQFTYHLTAPNHPDNPMYVSPFFFVKNGKQLKKIEWRDVVCLRSDRDYTRVITKNRGSYVISSSLQEALKSVVPLATRANFAQINQAEVLQISHIEEIFETELTIGAHVYNVNENYLGDLKQRLNQIM